MAPKSRLILFTFLSIVVVALPVFAASQGDTPGSYVPINDLNDPKVVKVAKFAVTEHNKEANSSLIFKKVVSGEYQIVSGTNYKLVIAATDGRTYQAVVYEKLPPNGLQLISFEENKIVGGYKPIPDLNNPKVVKLAKFAVTEHNKEANSSLKFKKVVSGEYQIVSGTNYKLVIAATDGRTYQAVVYKKLSQNGLQLISFVEIKIVGGYMPIQDPNNPEVVKVAKFAVTEHNKAATSSLKFKKVDSGESQVVSGINYRLVIAATDASKTKTYKALVYSKPWENILQLISFEEIKS